MHRLVARLCLATAVGLFATVSMAQEGGKVELKVGDKAPAFSLMGSDGKTYTLEQFKGKKPVVIAFFPKAFTGG